MNCNDENRLQKIICEMGIGTWNVWKAVCFKVVCEGDFSMLLFVSTNSFFYLLFVEEGLKFRLYYLITCQKEG